ncbi:MAG: DUF4403 family protein [Myxococcales bacterium]|nr:DUF4403 family protein [Myxococcales bacterium]
MNRSAHALAFLSLTLAACGATLYPPRPPATPGPPIADPTPSRVVIHTTISSAELRRQIEVRIPPEGEGSYTLMGTAQRYTWRRSPMELSFDQGRIGARTRVLASTVLFGQAIDVPIDVGVRAEPVVTADYRARLQSVEVSVSSSDTRLRLAQGVAGALDTLRERVTAKVREFAFDLRPMLAEAHARIARPIDFPVGDARACAELRVSGIEAGPTVLADGVEKELAVVIAPSVTLPCAAAGPPAGLPPLANVASLPSGPFTVTVPIAARYEELARAMNLVFADGKLFFSKEFPGLYLANPEVYAAGDQLVLKLRIAGPIKRGGFTSFLDGDIFMAGHAQVVDNELRVPDLQPTIETRSFLLKLKASLDGDAIRDQAREALRLDLGARLAAVRARLSSDLSFALGAGDGAGGAGCLRSNVSKIEVTGVYPHQAYLRLYVALTAQASVYLPCPALPRR